MGINLKTVWEVLHPYPEVAEGRVTEDSFVVSMGAIWEKLELGFKLEIDPDILMPKVSTDALTLQIQ